MSQILLSITSNRKKNFFSTAKKRASLVAFFCQEKIAFSSSWLSISIRAIAVVVIILSSTNLHSQQKTYCNPINIDYGYCPIPNFVTQGKHRATADPVITNFKGEFYLFSTNQWGYWHSKDMLNWKFISRKFLRPEHKVYDELCAPSLSFVNDTLLVVGSTHTKEFPIWMSTNPTKDDWKELVHKSQAGAWDPQIFWDKEKDEVYEYYGSSNTYPCSVKTQSKNLSAKAKYTINFKQTNTAGNDLENNDNTIQPFIKAHL
jgi:hypothetical protein